MQYTIENPDPDSCTVALSGNFTFSDNTAFKTILNTLRPSPPHLLIIDFGQTPFIDSAALGMLLLLREELREHVKLIILRNSQGQVRKMFELSKFDALFSVEE
jgi:anti-anti-sigma factor